MACFQNGEEGMGKPHNEESRRLAMARERRQHVVVVTVKNDPESELIVRLAQMLNMSLIVSGQDMSATLDAEHDIVNRLNRLHCREVWVVEMPGRRMEQAIMDAGYVLRVIDHHVYTQMRINRMRDPDTGVLMPSSLEQFMILAGIDMHELQRMGMDPYAVWGTGLYDSGAGRALRRAGFTKEQARATIALRTRIMREPDPAKFDREMAEARRLWASREWREWYSLIIAGGNVAPAVVQAALEDALNRGHQQDEQPIVLSAKDSAVTTVRHVEPAVIAHLDGEIVGAHTFVFGSDNCWGVDNRKGKRPVYLEEVLAALETAPH